MIKRVEVNYTKHLSDEPGQKDGSDISISILASEGFSRAQSDRNRVLLASVP